MSHRINIVIDDETWRFLEKVPQGKRSRTINLALREWMRTRRRRDAAAEMDQLRGEEGSTPVTTTEIVRWMREDREDGH